ncbi:response regulator [candidate division KSB1 bacterium]|nr:response regulator [candidate division KSB1 bacterium]
MNSKESIKILIVEDEKIVASDIQNSLIRMGYSTLGIASSGDEALEKTREFHPDIVLMDIRLEGEMDGIDSALKIRERFHIPVIYLTAYADDSTLQRAKISEPYGYILKPFDSRDLHTSIEMALYKHKMEKKLKESEKWYATTLNSIGDGVITTNTRGEITFINPVAQKITGLSEPDILKIHFSKIFKIAISQTDNSLIDLFANDQNELISRNIAQDALLISESGREIPINFTKTLMRDINNNIMGAVFVFQDITERKKAEYELAAEKERLLITLASIADAVITTDIDGKIVLMNRVAEQITGYTQSNAQGKSILEILKIKANSGLEKLIHSIIHTGKTINRSDDFTLKGDDGSEKIISCSGAPIHDNSNNIIGMVIVFSDISEKRKFENELLKIQKLESVGILAGGIAHDFNNILTAIIGNLSLAKIDLKPDQEIYEILTEAEKASQQARHLTNQLLTFSRGGAPIKKVMSINKVIQEAAEFSLSGSTVKAKYEISHDLKKVNIDSGQFKQVIHNLVLNAIQAMPDGGSMRISAENVYLSESDSIPLPAGEHVKISVVDQGIGIKDEHLDKIFDPYFTTKQMGSGLGLATTYSVVKKHGGHINVDSELGRGSTFTIYLPAAEADTTQEYMPEKEKDLKGRILIMDDEEFVIKPLSRMLQSLGFETEIATNGEQAIEKYKLNLSKDRTFDLVILDLTIQGGMGGKETIKNLRELDPDVKAIVTSGYSNDPVMADYRQYGFIGVIAKPYKVDEIKSVIRKVLAKPVYY